jgi:adenylate cyclase
VFVLSHRAAGKMRRYTLPPGDSVVGRAPTSDIFVEDVSVSRRHARFTVTRNGCTVADLSSRNGTYVNSNLVTQAELADGDRIVVGRVPFIIEWLPDQLTLSDHHTISEDESTILRPLTSLKAQAASDARNARFLQLLSDVARMLVANASPNEVFGQIVQIAFETCPAERAFLVLRDETTGSIVARVARNRDGTDIQSGSLSRTIINRVMTERVSILATDAQTDRSIGSSDSIRVLAVRSFMCAPLWHAPDVIGVVYVDAPQIQRFTSADLDLFIVLANLAAIAIEQARLNARVSEEIRRRGRLERYHSAGVVQRIFEAGADLDAPFFAQERDVSVLFVDIVGFTSMSEMMTSAQTASLLNGFFEKMADCIFDEEGTLDKFIGDAVMAVFGAPLDQPDHALRAVRTAHRMQSALARLNAESTGAPIRIRIGIHSGQVRAGDIGSVRRREYTVLGDVVNTASRLESSVAKPGQIVISRTTLDRLDGSIGVRPLGLVTLRGRQEPVEIFDASPDLPGETQPT